jgi:hypothetical protein
VWFGSGRWGGSIGWGWWNKFSILSNKKEKRKNNYILIIQLSDWTIIYFASILEITTMLVYDQPQMLKTVNQVYKGISNINLMI